MDKGGQVDYLDFQKGFEKNPTLEATKGTMQSWSERQYTVMDQKQLTHQTVGIIVNFHCGYKWTAGCFNVPYYI